MRDLPPFVAGASRVPFGLKAAYTLWMLLWVPVYWLENGWTNFLWLCDAANFLLLAALWTESALLVSSQLAGITFIQIVWAIDFFGRLLIGTHPVGGTEYMFDDGSPWWLRALSLFHLWTVPLLIWLARKLGHDRRGWQLQALLVLLLFPLGQQLGAPEQNLNWMWAPFGIPQVWLPPLPFAFLGAVVFIAVVLWPSELLVRRWLEPRLRYLPEALASSASSNSA